MPQAVDAFTSSQNIFLVRERQEDILRLYRYDISKYAKQGRRLAIREIYDQMPAQLDSQSKRFNFSTIAPKGTYERYKDDFFGSQMPELQYPYETLGNQSLHCVLLRIEASSNFL